MPSYISDIAFTPQVKAEQEKRGSRAIYEKMVQTRDFHDRVTPELAAFLAERNSLYLGTATADGQPYIQHRGGPKGLLRVLADKPPGVADFSGTRQYLTVGNLAQNAKAYLFLMDYANRWRIKLWGRAHIVEGDDALIAKVSDPAYKARIERVMLFEIAAWDSNCPQHIPRLIPAEEADATINGLMARIGALEAEVARLKA